MLDYEEGQLIRVECVPPRGKQEGQVFTGYYVRVTKQNLLLRLNKEPMEHETIKRIPLEVVKETVGLFGCCCENRVTWQ